MVIPISANQRSPIQLAKLAGLNRVNSRDDFANVLPNDPPPSRRQDEDRQAPSGQILLVAKVLIRGHEHIERRTLGRAGVP
jgi:hypothetical protein